MATGGRRRNSLTGEIVQAYFAALTAHKFKPFAGTDGAWQPADLADFFLHETVVAWVRKWFRKRPFKAVEDIDKNYVLFLDRLKECEGYINDNLKVEDLCRDAVARLKQLRDQKGQRLKF